MSVNRRPRRGVVDADEDALGANAPIVHSPERPIQPPQPPAIAQPNIRPPPPAANADDGAGARNPAQARNAQPIQLDIIMQMQNNILEAMQRIDRNSQNLNVVMNEIRANNPPLPPARNVQPAVAPQNANPRGPRTHHLKSSEIKIPSFAGSSDEKTPFDYLLEMEKYQSIVGYSDEDILGYVIPVSLTRDAYTWYRYEAAFESWADFKTRLRNEFQAIGYIDDLKKELDSRYQGPNETLTVFIRVILDYYIRIGENVLEADQVAKIKKLMHPEYRKALIGIRTNTLAELRAAAPQAQELIKNYRSYKLPPTTGSLEPSLAWKPVNKQFIPQSRGDANAAISLDPNRSHKLHPAAVDPFAYYHAERKVRFTRPENRSPSPRPTPTGSPSQSRDNSPVRRCFKCNEIGHFARQCPKNENTNSPIHMMSDISDELATVELANKDKRPFIKVGILGKEYSAFLDTGSSISVLGDDVIELIKDKNIKCRKVNKKIKFLKGDYTAIEACTLTVSYGADSRKHTFYLAPGTITTVLLGRDFLGPAMIAVHIGYGGWTIGTEPQKVIPFIVSKSPFLSSYESTHVDTSEDEMLVQECEYPAKILATWDHIDEPKPIQEQIEEISLFPNTSHDEIKAPAFLSTPQIDSITQIMSKYTRSFTRKPGLCTAYMHSIDTGDHKPVSTTLRPMTPAKRKIFDESFLELLELNIIEPSYSPWSANAFVVPKKDGSLRPVIDYKPINKVTVPDVYPIPRINDQLAILGPCSWFSLFDISKGYFQIAMKEEDRPKTAFISHHGI